MSAVRQEPIDEAGAVLRMAFAFVTSQVLYQAADLGIVDHLTSGALSVSELASRIGTHAGALARVLQALVAFGILTREGEERYGLTPAGQLLRTDTAGSLRSTVRFIAGPWAWRAFEHLGHSIRTSEPSFDHVWGMSNFEYWERNPDVSKIHDEAMTGLTATETARVLGAYDFAPFRKIVDVGGGNGALLAAILGRQPKTVGVLSDLPHVISLASGVVQEAGVADRCEMVGSDFFQAVPPGGDAYILKHILHNWDDERACTILKRCHVVVAPSARLLIIDRVRAEQPRPEDSLGYVVALTMLALTPGGRERTLREFRNLLESAGFELVRVIEAGGISDILEAKRR